MKCVAITNVVLECRVHSFPFRALKLIEGYITEVCVHNMYIHTESYEFYFNV